MKLYPLQFKPIFKSKIWGGDQLNTLKKINPPINQLGESWEISVVPDDESIVLDDFKDGAFRLAIEHQIPLVPMTFHDTKKRFSYTFFSGAPGKLRVKIHQFLPTRNLNLENRRELKEKTWNIIYQELTNPTIH